MAGLPVSHLDVFMLMLRTCKLTGAAAFSGVGIYALMEAKTQGAFSKVRPKGAPIVGGPVTAALGVGECKGPLMLMVVFLTLGVGRLFI